MCLEYRLVSVRLHGRSQKSAICGASRYTRESWNLLFTDKHQQHGAHGATEAFLGIHRVFSPFQNQSWKKHSIVANIIGYSVCSVAVCAWCPWQFFWFANMLKYPKMWGMLALEANVECSEIRDIFVLLCAVSLLYSFLIVSFWNKVERKSRVGCHQCTGDTK